MLGSAGNGARAAGPDTEGWSAIDVQETPGGARRERKDARQNLERVLAAAQALFAERGGDVTMEEVARRAGVGVGTVYRRFPSKEHLFTAVSHAACSDAQRCLHEAAQAERDAVRKLRALVVVHYHRGAAHAALLEPHSSAVAEARRGSFGEQQQLYAALHHLLQHGIEEGQQQGVMRPGDPAVLAAICLELLSPRALNNLRRVVKGDVDAVADQVVQFVVRGLQ